MPEPYLVRGVQAQVSGHEEEAGRAFAAAELRDGRSLPARYFLADHYFRKGDAAHGLSEIAYLARALPEGVERLAPYVAIYARDPKNRPGVLKLFRSDARLADASLSALAANPSEADLVQSLGAAVPLAPATQWPSRLIDSLVSAGNYERAHALWVSLYRIGADGNAPIFDPGFRGSSAPRPFNWTLSSSSVGVAERSPNGLHVIYYGQEEGQLATQLLLLKPGAYRLSARISGDPARSTTLAWKITCANSKEAVGLYPLDPAQAGRGWILTVAPNCPAQELTLIGKMSDMPQQADVTISGLKLEPANG